MSSSHFTHLICTSVFPASLVQTIKLLRNISLFSNIRIAQSFRRITTLCLGKYHSFKPLRWFPCELKEFRSTKERRELQIRAPKNHRNSNHDGNLDPGGRWSGSRWQMIWIQVADDPDPGVRWSGSRGQKDPDPGGRRIRIQGAEGSGSATFPPLTK